MIVESLDAEHVLVLKSVPLDHMFEALDFAILLAEGSFHFG